MYTFFTLWIIDVLHCIIELRNENGKFYVSLYTDFGNRYVLPHRNWQLNLEITSFYATILQLDSRFESFS